MPALNRRSFLATSCLAACAGVFSPSASLGAVVSSTATRLLAQPLPATPGEDALLAFVRGYSREVRFVGMGVLTQLREQAAREVHWLVEVSDPAAFDAALARRNPFAGAFSHGSTLSLVSEGIEFTIENLMPEAFAQRLQELATARGVVFAHDGLVYDPATLTLADPFGAEKSRTLKFVNTTLAGGAAIGAALLGRAQAVRLKMNTDGRFNTWQARNLGLNASAISARVVAQTFLSKLATIAETLTPAAMKSLLRSRAISSALMRIFGLKVAPVIAQYDRLQRRFAGEYPAAALWLALLLGPEIESETADGAATTWLERGTRFDVLRSRKALAQARELLTSVS